MDIRRLIPVNIPKKAYRIAAIIAAPAVLAFILLILWLVRGHDRLYYESGKTAYTGGLVKGDLSRIPDWDGVKGSRIPMDTEKNTTRREYCGMRANGTTG